jgi:AcrR family transcriptional regulator
MVRLTRVQQQARTRATVLAAARAEFTEHGYAAAKIDRIAARADLTRGAVYSNFPSKRSLYLAVLLDAREPAAAGVEPPTGTSGELPAAVDLAAGAEAFARVWLERLPLAVDTSSAGKLKARSTVGVFDDERGRTTTAELTVLEGLLLALALESCRARAATRRVRLAELILTLLAGAGHLAEQAPGIGDPFDVARACRHLAALDVEDVWSPAHLPFVAAPEPRRDPWTPPADLIDLLGDRPTDLGADGVLVVLGSGRLSAAEEAIRAARPGDQVTVAIVTDDPAETGALIRLRITDLAACLRQVFGSMIRPSLQLVLDDTTTIAAALDAGSAPDTEFAVRIRSGEIVARARGRGAGYAAATEGQQ